jgi:hypothetical protein
MYLKREFTNEEIPFFEYSNIKVFIVLVSTVDFSISIIFEKSGVHRMNLSE